MAASVKRFQDKKDPYWIIEVLHYCQVRKFRFQNGNLEAVLEAAYLYLIEMFENSQNIHWKVFSKTVIIKTIKTIIKQTT